MRLTDFPPWAQQAGQRMALGFGRLTAAGRMSPGFLICGAQRCGTTSMYRALSQHPAILKAVLHKGIHYFDTGYQSSALWYRAHFPLRAHARLIACRQGIEPVTYESSPYYLFHPLSASRIARDLPDVRIIVLVRDPVERAYSAYTHERARGFETEEFETALGLEDSRLAGEEERIVADPGYYSYSHQHHAYLRRGRYLEQLRRIEEVIGRDRLHVVDSDDFFGNPLPAWREVVRFLRLPDSGPPVFDQHNARPRSPMPPSVRTQLRDQFQPYDEALARWWGHEPSWRR